MTRLKGSINKKNQKLLEGMEKGHYMPAFRKIFLDSVRKIGVKKTADRLTNIMQSAREKKINPIINRRKKSGEIEDIQQTSKAVAGRGFQALVVMTLIEMQRQGHLPNHLVFVTSPTKNTQIATSTTITVGAEKLKPDMDLLIYSESRANLPYYIVSVKTSLRERAGQTHRWKLLYDIVTATDCRSLKKKYKLKYQGNKNIKMGLITTNFYNEITDKITSPQHRGLFEFFNGIYLTKPNKTQPPVKRFSSIIADLKEIYASV